MGFKQILQVDGFQTEFAIFRWVSNRNCNFLDGFQMDFAIFQMSFKQNLLFFYMGFK